MIDLMASVYGRTLNAAAWIPFALAGVIGISGRSNPEPQLAPEYGKQMDALIEQYVEPVKASNAVKTDTLERAPRADIHRAASVWLKLSANGEPKRILRVSADDTSRAGVKRDIVEAQGVIVDGLRWHAMNELKAGKVSLGLEDLALTIKMLQFGKNFDLTSYTLAVRNENQVLKQAAPYLDHATPQQIQTFASVGDPEGHKTVENLFLEEMTFFIQAAQYDEHLAQSIEKTKNEFVQAMGSGDEDALLKKALRSSYGDATISIGMVRQAFRCLRERSGENGLLAKLPSQLVVAKMD